MNTSIDHTTLMPVTEITGLTSHELTETALSLTEPTIFRGLVNDWPLVQQCKKSPEAAMQYLTAFDNGKDVHTMIADPEFKGRFFYNNDLTDFNFTREKQSLNNVLSAIKAQSSFENKKSYYVGSTSISHILPGFRAENDITALHEKPMASVWIGNQSRIAAHYDIPDNLACVAVGKRRFTLFPPEQLCNLYVGPLDYTPAGQPASLVDFHEIDNEKFPKFNDALQHAYTATLTAGDALFIPSMWWHHVEALSDINVLVNYWWRQVDNFIGTPTDALYHAILSIRDLPIEQKNAWRDIFEAYIFAPKAHNHIPENKRGILNPVDELMARQIKAMLINKLNR